MSCGQLMEGSSTGRMPLMYQITLKRCLDCVKIKASYLDTDLECASITLTRSTVLLINSCFDDLSKDSWCPTLLVNSFDLTKPHLSNKWAKSPFLNLERIFLKLFSISVTTEEGTASRYTVIFFFFFSYFLFLFFPVPGDH